MYWHKIQKKLYNRGFIIERSKYISLRAKSNGDGSGGLTSCYQKDFLVQDFFLLEREREGVAAYYRNVTVFRKFNCSQISTLSFRLLVSGCCLLWSILGITKSYRFRYFSYYNIIIVIIVIRFVNISSINLIETNFLVSLAIVVDRCSVYSKESILEFHIFVA